MDPNATLEYVDKCLRAGATFGAWQAARDLYRWIRRGGFAPDWDEHPRAAGYVRRTFPV